MKITSKILREQLGRIKAVSPYCVEGAPEHYLRDSLRIAANALDRIHSENGEEGNEYYLPNSFQLDTDLEPSDLPEILEPLDSNEDNPVRLWAEIWKLRSETKGPDDYETWRDAAIDEKMKRVKAEQKLQALRDKLLTLSQGSL